MTKHELPDITLHRDVPLFREAVSYTAARTGFPARLIEKDYFCTLVLAYFDVAGDGRMIFRGGTALAKVLLEFYRLSEDLDFIIPMPVDAARRERSNRVRPVNVAMSGLTKALPGFEVHEPLRGSNNSMQYNGAVRYASPTTGQPDVIGIEVSLREPLLMPAIEGQARTLLLNPVTDQPFVKDIPVTCMSGLEALAEKFRAALSRPEIAIRDFYDVDYASRHLSIGPDDDALVDLLRHKLAVPGNQRFELTTERLAELRSQLDTRLRAVLRADDQGTFDLDHAINIVMCMAEKVL